MFLHATLLYFLHLLYENDYVNMKRYLFLIAVLGVLVTSCSLDDETSSALNTVVLPIVSVEVPEQFVLGQSHEIFMTYTRPNSCYEFYDFIYEIDGHERTIGIVNTVYTRPDCTQEAEDITVSLDFTPTTATTYLFKFYQGVDDNGIDQYYLVEIPVSASRTTNPIKN